MILFQDLYEAHRERDQWTMDEDPAPGAFPGAGFSMYASVANIVFLRSFSFNRKLASSKTGLDGSGRLRHRAGPFRRRRR
jgi:hypothetical protein